MYIPGDFSYSSPDHPLNSISSITSEDAWDISNGAVVTQSSNTGFEGSIAEEAIGYEQAGPKLSSSVILHADSDFIFNITEEQTIRGLYIHTDGDRSTRSFQLYSKDSNDEWVERANVNFMDSGILPFSGYDDYGSCVIFAVDFPDFTGSEFLMKFGSSYSRLVGAAPRIHEVDVITTLPEPPEPLAPVLDLETFYESNSGENITIDATAIGGYPNNYTYQWYFNDALISPSLGGSLSSISLSGISIDNGTWKVEVTNDTGITSAEFEYRLFADADNDGLSDYREFNIVGTNPNNADSDSDGLSDLTETNTGIWIDGSDTGTNPLSADTDNDGLLDGVETNTSVYIDTTDTGTDPLNADTDSDGLNDGAETSTRIYVSSSDTGTNPLDNDSDLDGILDGYETVTGTWVSGEDTGTNPNKIDSDTDGLSDGIETNSGIFIGLLDTGTDPNSQDSDGDGFTDKFEIDTSYDPTSFSDTPDAYSFIETAVEVNFYGAIGATYQIEHTEDLESGVWVILEDGIEGSSELIERLYSTDDYSHRIFRVVRSN